MNYRLPAAEKVRLSFKSRRTASRAPIGPDHTVVSRTEGWRRSRMDDAPCDQDPSTRGATHLNAA
jgi:hypothetical protein